MTRATVVPLVAAVLLAACGPRQPPPTMVRQHPDLLARKSTLPRLTILPPRVQVEELAFDDDVTRLRDVEDQIESQLQDLIGAHMRDRDFTLQPAHLEPGDLDAGNDLRFQLSEVYQSYSQLAWSAYRKGPLPPDTALNYKATMGSAINPFADRAAADAVLFVNMYAVTKSTGLRGKDVFYTVLFALGGVNVEVPAAAAVLEVALIDGTSGELLWSHRVGATFRSSLDPAFLVNLAFEKFPGAQAPEAN